MSIWPFVTCMTCQHCRAGRTMLCSQRKFLGGDHEGTFCEYVAVPAVNCIPVPAELSDELAAVATDCIATA